MLKKQACWIYTGVDSGILRKYKRSVKCNMFPSQNNKKLGKVITKKFKIMEAVKKFKACCVVLNGEPGLGKTSFLDYYASADEAVHISYVNALSFTSSFKEWVNCVIKFLPEKRNLLIIDEIDKFINFSITEKVYNLVESLELDNSSKDFEKRQLINAEEIRANTELCVKNNLLLEILHLIDEER